MDDEEPIILRESGSPHEYSMKKKMMAKVISSFRYLAASKLSKWSFHYEKN
jgi:hypothetical protein